MNLQILLMNTQTITATKVQAVVGEFMQGKAHTSIFCFTEIKVNSIDFKPVGLKIFRPTGLKSMLLTFISVKQKMLV